MPLFSAAYAQIKAQQFYNDLGLYIALQKIAELKDFSRLLSGFPVLLKADLIFKDFSRSLLNSSTFQACANPVLTLLRLLPKEQCDQGL